MSWRRFLKRGRWDRERLEELESYLQMEIDQNVARGMPYAEAHALARRKLGNRTLIREEIYRMNTLAFLDTLIRDVRYSLRALRLNPVFTAVALLTIAIGIGANTAVFSVVNSVLLKPLPYPEPEQLVAVRQAAPGAPGLGSVSGDLRLSPSMFVTYSEHNRSFQSLGVWDVITVTVTGLADPEQVRAVLVSDGTLQALNVAPVVGRWLGPADQVVGSQETVMLNYGYWQRRFGGDRSVIGRNISVDSRPRVIAGVMPAGFRFGETEGDLILPVRFDRNRMILANFSYQGIARLKPGVSIAQANADLARLVSVWMDSWSNGPGSNPRIYETWHITPALLPLKDDVIGNVRKVLWVLMATIGIVMLIACANVANLLLVRAESRQQELAVRAALGAGWGRIVRELLVESVVLAVLGGALGLGLAQAGLQFLLRLSPSSLPRLNEISIDPRALTFTLAVSLISGLLFGALPAFKYAGSRIALGARGASQSRERHRASSTLVIAQVALALVLLISSGLMIRTFQSLRTIEPGFTHPEQIQTIRTSIPRSLIADSERVARVQNAILEKLAAIPGVTSVALASEMPMEGIQSGWDAILEEGQPLPDVIPPLRQFRSLSPGYLRTAGTKLVAGREFTWTDIFDRRPVVMISENLARELWGSPSAALRRRIGPIPGNWREVIGVVQDVRENGVDQPAPAIVYWPFFREAIYDKGQVEVTRAGGFAIRSSRAGRESFLTEVRQAVWSVNANLPVASVRTMQEVMDRSMARTSFTLVMLAIAAAMALVLGIVGIYGVISYAVSQRRREIGIRLALGAQQAELRKMFVRHGLILASIGVALGMVAAMGLAGLMKSLLFGISPLDPTTFAAVPAVLILAAMVASYVPARRAAKVDPMDALRESA